LLKTSEQFLSLHYVAVPAQPWKALEQAWDSRLPPGRLDVLLRRREPADRNASLLGIALLEAACRERGLAFDPATLLYPPRGKPTLPLGPDFSIAHAGGLAACLCWPLGAVGVDLEPAGAVGAGSLRLALGAAERARVAAGEFDPTAAWVMTEAVLKAVGLGIDAASRVRLGRSLAAATIDGRTLHLRPAALGPAYVAWVAHEQVAAGLRLVAHEPAEFAPLP